MGSIVCYVTEQGVGGGGGGANTHGKLFHISYNKTMSTLHPMSIMHLNKFHWVIRLIIQINAAVYAYSN